MQISEVPNNERPFEKANKYGIETLSNQEILSLIIRVGVKDNSVLDIAMQILQLIYDKNLNMDSLLEIKGVSRIQATKILAIIEFAKRYHALNYTAQLEFKCANNVYLYYKSRLQGEKQEQFIVLYLDNKGGLIQEKRLFVGSMNSATVDPKIIYSHALKLGSNKIICIHNHPSGDVTPSKADDHTTETLKVSSLLMDIVILDHIIIGDGYYSYREHKRL